MPNPPRERKRARELAAEFNQKNDPTGWFEALYREAESGTTTIPWADLAPNPHLLDFWQAHPQPSAHKTAVVVGSALGDDAEQLSHWGFQTTAFDISETAIRRARHRFPDSKVTYATANLLTPPPEWHQKFDFVFEAYTLQALPEQVRALAETNVAAFVAPQGHLLVVARARDASEPPATCPGPSLAQNSPHSSKPVSLNCLSRTTTCPGPSLAQNSPHSSKPVSLNCLSRTTSTITKLRLLAGFVPSTNAVKVITSRLTSRPA